MCKTCKIDVIYCRTLQEIARIVYFLTNVNILRVNIKKKTGFKEKKMSKKSSSGHPSKYAYIGDLINFRNTLYTESHGSPVSPLRQLYLSLLKYRADIVK